MHKNKVKLEFASLFSGCGGFDLGFIQEGFKCVVALDNDPYALDTYEQNLKSRAINYNLANGNIGLPSIRNVDVLLAGPPCQGFSTAGKRDFYDPRNKLLLKVSDIVAQVKPKVVLVENVSAVSSSPHNWYWEKLRHGLRFHGYRTAEVVCKAENFGVAQHRKRLVMLAWRFPRDVSIILRESRPTVLRDALSGVEKARNHEITELSDSGFQIKIAKRIMPGQKLCNVRGGPRAVHSWDIPEVFGKTTQIEKLILESIMYLRRRIRRRDTGDADPVSPKILERKFGRSLKDVLISLERKHFIRKLGHRYDLVGTFNGKYRRLCWDQPSYTVDTRFGDPRFFLHPSRDGGFTVREAARIQGFPDSFVFNAPIKIQYQLIGNAVPPPVSKSLARFVREAFFS